MGNTNKSKEKSYAGGGKQAETRAFPPIYLAAKAKRCRSCMIAGLLLFPRMRESKEYFRVDEKVLLDHVFPQDLSRRPWVMGSFVSEAVLLLDVAPGAGLGVFGGEGLLAIMAVAAEFSFVEIRHLHLGGGGQLLHLEELGLGVAIRALLLLLGHVKFMAERNRAERLGVLVREIRWNGDFRSHREVLTQPQNDDGKSHQSAEKRELLEIH